VILGHTGSKVWADCSERNLSLLSDLDPVDWTLDPTLLLPLSWECMGSLLLP
jgi:hypothetical protein